MIRSRTFVRAIAAIGALVALSLANDAVADYHVTVKIKVELPPGVKPSDVKVETGSPAHPDVYRLNDKGEVELRTSGYDNDLTLTISGPNIFSRKIIWADSIATGNSTSSSRPTI